MLNAVFHKKSTTTAIQLIMYIASRDESNTEKKGEYYHIRLDIQDFIIKHNVKRLTILNHLKKIQETVITFYNNDKKELKTMIPIISKAKELTRGIIRVDMNDEIYKMIKSNKNFSVLSASNYQKKLSFNALRVLMLIGLINEQTIKRKKYNLEELNFLFDTKYKSLYEIDRQIFSKAKKELDSNSNISFNFVKNETLKIAKGRPRIQDIRIEVLNNNNYQGKLL